MEFNLIFGSPLGLHIKNNKVLYDGNKLLGLVQPHYSLDITKKQFATITMDKAFKPFCSPGFLKRLRDITRNKFFKFSKGIVRIEWI